MVPSELDSVLLAEPAFTPDRRYLSEDSSLYGQIVRSLSDSNRLSPLFGLMFSFWFRGARASRRLRMRHSHRIYR